MNLVNILPSRRPNRWPFILIVGALSLVIVALGTFHLVFKQGFIAQKIAESEMPPPVVSAQAAVVGTVTPEVRAVGSLEAVNGVDVAAEVSGTVQSIRFESGQLVRRGQVLVELSAGTEQADVRLERSAVETAERDLKRARTLAATGTVTKAFLDRAEAEFNQASARLNRAMADVGKRQIRAPFDGRLGIREINAGQFVNAGDKIVNLQTVHPIYATFDVPERQLGSLRVGQSITVTLPALGGRVVTGQITSVDSRIDPDTRNITLQATLPNEDGGLTPGMFANISINIEAAQTQAVMIPETAISYSVAGDSVYVLTAVPEQAQTLPDGSSRPYFRADRKFVKVGVAQGGMVPVESGLQAGETVVTAGQLKLRTGDLTVVNNSIPLPTGQPLPRE